MNEELLKLYKLLNTRYLKKKEIINTLKINNDSIISRKKNIIYMYAILSLDNIYNEIKRQLKYNKYSITKNNMIRIINILLNNIDDINYLLPGNSNNLLILAIMNNYNEIAKLLIDKGININYTISNVVINNALLMSIYNNNKVIFNYLLNNPNININFLNCERRTALFYVTHYKKYYYAKKLIESGININHLDIYNNPVIKYAVDIQNIDLIKTIINHYTFDINYINNIDNNILFKLVDLNIKGTISTLIHKGINTNNINKNGYDLIYYLVIKHKISLADMIIDRINVNKLYDNNDSLLHIMIRYNCISLAKKLIIMYKPDIYKVNNYGESILSMIKKTNHYGLISLIEKHYNIQLNYHTSNINDVTINKLLDDYNSELNMIASNLCSDTIIFLEQFK